MSTFRIIADVACDLTPDLQKKYDIAVVPGHMLFPGNREVTAVPEWGDTTAEAFFTALKANPSGYSTAPANVEEFKAFFRPYAEKGEDMLVMAISSGISGTFNFMQRAREELLAEFPGVTIRCVDTLRFGPGFGLMCMDAARKRDAGLSLQETADWLEANKNRYHQAGWLDDLTFVARKGRISHAAAFFGSLAGVKPIGEFDYNGLTTVLAKARGAKSAYAALLDYISKTIENPEEQTIVIAQTCRMPQAEEYKKMLQERFHPKEIMIIDVHAFNGINIGPGLMAAYYVGKPISKDLSEEKAILQNFMNGGK